MSSFGKLVLLFAFLAGSAFAQGYRYDNILLGPTGSPKSGATVAVCQITGLATTAASVSSNVATLTMASNPVAAGFIAGGSVTVSGFTGADTYFNGGFTLTAVTSTQLQFSLTHANASATSNGAVIQSVGVTATCAPFASIFTDSALTMPAVDPLNTSGLGNYGFDIAPGTYPISFNGAGVTPTTNTLTIPCVTNSTCPLTAGVTVTGSPSAGNLTVFSGPGSVTNSNLSLPSGPDTLVARTSTDTLTNKTFDISANILRNSTNTAGHVPRNNGTQYVDAQLSFSDLSGNASASQIPAGNSCSANQFANSLGAGLALGCAQPSFSNLSGTAGTSQIGTGTPAASEYVDGGTGAWTALPSGTTADTVVSWGSNSQAQPTTVGCVTGATQCMEFILPLAHTLKRLTYHLYTAASGCSTNAVIGLFDETAAATVSSLTVTTGVGFKDSGALSVATTAAHTFALEVITAAGGCTTTPSVGQLTAVFE